MCPPVALMNIFSPPPAIKLPFTPLEGQEWARLHICQHTNQGRPTKFASNGRIKHFDELTAVLCYQQ